MCPSETKLSYSEEYCLNIICYKGLAAVIYTILPKMTLINLPQSYMYLHVCSMFIVVFLVHHTS